MTAYEGKNYKSGNYSNYNNIQQAKLILLKETIFKKLVGKNPLIHIRGKKIGINIPNVPRSAYL